MITLNQLLLVFVGITCGAVGALFLKLGAVRISYDVGAWEIAKQVATNGYIVAGFALYAIPSFLWVVLLKTIPISVLQPILALTYVLTPLMAIFFASEVVPPLRWIGIGIIILGVIVVARS